MANLMGKNRLQYIESIARSVFDGTAWILSSQKTDRFWGKTLGQGPDIFSTYIALWALDEVGLTETNEVSKSLAWLLQSRNNDGGWSQSMSLRSDVDATTRALITFARFKKFPKSYSKALTDVVLANKNEDGSWSRELIETHEPETLKTSQVGDVGATLPIITLLSMLKHVGQFQLLIEPHFYDAKQWLLGLSSGEEWPFQENGPVDILPTCWAIRALHDAGERNDIVDRAVNYILSTQRNDGGWGKENSTIIYTYNAVHSLTLWGRDVFDPVVKRGIKWLISKKNSDGSWGESNIGTTRYTASAVLILARALKRNISTSAYPLMAGLYAKRTFHSMQMASMLQKKRFVRKRSLAFLILVVAVSAFFLGKYSDKILSFWTGLSLLLKGTIGVGIFGVLTIIIINIVSNFITNFLRKGRR